MRDFEEMSMGEVILLAKDNDRGACFFIFKKYEGLIHRIIKKKNYFLPGAEYEDLVQEGHYGVIKAVNDFKEEMTNDKEKVAEGFETFLKICIERQLISAIKTATRKKHTPLNEMIPLDRPLPENDNLSMMDIFGARSEVQHNVDFDSLNPEHQLILNEIQTNYQKILDEVLSDVERDVYYLHVEEKSYKEIMKDLGINNPKKIDNAIQRVKRKIELIRNNDLFHSDKKTEKDTNLLTQSEN